MLNRISLPIDQKISEIQTLLETHRNLIIQATPGSGKTTRVPPALLLAKFMKPEQEILVLVPRRLAAKMAALRVAEENQEKIGELIGYQFRFENVTSSKTRLRFLTEGLLLRRLIHDPQLTQVAAVILDEFHERHLHSDIALSYLHQLQKTTRPDLRLVVMSATLDIPALSQFLDNCPVIKLEAQQYPITLNYLAKVVTQPLEILVRDQIKFILANALHRSGNILVFLPGMAEIRRCEQALSEHISPQILILPLHGELPKAEQELIFQKTQQIKIILATNIAETSLTIEGVSTVIDSGLHKQASYSFWSGVPALKTKSISRASAIQRAGRSGRTSAGYCLRLYTKSDFDGRAEFELPEIRRADLTQTVLELKALGIVDVKNFPWFEMPSESALVAVTELLFRLGTLSDDGATSTLSPLGKRMAELPVSPRLSRLLLEAEKYQVLPEASLLAALINEDELDDLDALNCLHHSRIPETVKRLQTQLLSYFQKYTTSKPKSSLEKEQALKKCILVGFPDRVAKKRSQNSAGNQKPQEDLIFCLGGSGSVIAQELILANEYFVILDVQERQHQGQVRSKMHVKSLCAIEADWLLDVKTGFVKEIEEFTWDEKFKRVVELSQLKYGDLILTETQTPPLNAQGAVSILLKRVLGLDTEKLKNLNAHDLLQALSHITDPEECENTFAKLLLFKQYFPNSDLPDFATQGFGDLIETALVGFFSEESLRALNFSERFLATLPQNVHAQINEWLPKQVTLSAGRKVRVNYALGKAPWVESRLQDFFGMKTGPKLLQGKLPVTLHLLAPNRRPVQVTTDLESFWQNTYQKIRPGLSRKYPRQSWPEKP